MNYLTEVSHDVTTLIVGHGHDVEQKWLNVVVKRLVIEEELGEQTQLLAVLLVFATVHLPHA